MELIRCYVDCHYTFVKTYPYRRSIFKIVDLDEAWSFTGSTRKTLSMKLVRAGRAMSVKRLS